MALDERRPSFLQTRLQGATEVWFRGAHSDIGGGNQNPGLNDITLKWMFSKAKAAGLPIGDADIAALHPDPATPPKPVLKLPVAIRPISAVDHVHYTVSPLAGATNPPATCIVESIADEQAGEGHRRDRGHPAGDARPDRRDVGKRGRHGDAAQLPDRRRARRAAHALPGPQRR